MRDLSVEAIHLLASVSLYLGLCSKNCLLRTSAFFHNHKINPLYGGCPKLWYNPYTHSIVGGPFVERFG